MEQPKKARTGVAGLDDILGGGFSRGSLFVIEGSPGAGKTTLGLQFLLDGERQGETGLYITLSETADELRSGAASHGWTIGPKIEVFELIPPESLLDADQQQSLLYSSDLELKEATHQIFQAVERLKPSRVVLDSMSEIRLLAQSSLRYRRQILAIKHFFARHGATVLLLDDLTAEASDKTVHSVAHGVLLLEELAPKYGAERRRARILKYRGQGYRGGYHDFTIATGGLNMFPRLVALEHRTEFKRLTLSTGIESFDALLGGGIEAGSSTLILGPAGTGKTLIAISFVASAIKRGEKAAIFMFDEELGLFLRRMKALGFDLEAHIANGDLVLEQIDSAELSPGEFAHRVRAVVDKNKIRTVVIDSLNGYQSSMQDEHSLILHIHELLQYLNRQGAATFLNVAQHGITGEMKTPIDVTYLADTVILLRFFEAMGQIRRAISVIKKRTGGHETSIREFTISGKGLLLGEPLVNFHGILRGVPTYAGSGDDLKTKAP
ncbi:MAG: AAA family ATPase [Alphaproteobacteria bacterium]|nr:AAA family ATPase [Alphaproteobacteria bacterium]